MSRAVDVVVIGAGAAGLAAGRALGASGPSPPRAVAGTDGYTDGEQPMGHARGAQLARTPFRCRLVCAGRHRQVIKSAN